MTSMTTIECTAEQLAAICAEADQAYFGTAANLGLRFMGGFDHAEVAANRWSVKLHDRGLSGRSHDFRFAVPVAARTAKRGPAR